MFVDKVKVKIQAGDGGNGVVSFRHEKFVEKGGPDGGDGGRGGDVILRASRNQNTLAAFRYKKVLKAQSGSPGGKRKRHGKNAQNLVVDVPIGTQVLSDKGKLLSDLTYDGRTFTIARGGRGGYGNAHFVSSTRQAPRFAEKGETGESLTVILELKMIADVGLVGLPNAGKSTLLASISHARPLVADYPFTTLSPNLGVVDIDHKTSLLVADIPGLIEGASRGKGLGDEFLRHIERTSVLVHLIDVYEDVEKAYKTVQNELKAYKTDLTKRPQLVVLNKIEGLSKGEVKQKLAELKRIVPKRTPILAISAKSQQGVKELISYMLNLVQKTKAARKRTSKKILPILKLPTSDETWQIKRNRLGFTISGKKIERFAKQTDFNNPEAVLRLRDIMSKMGIEHELIRKGVESGNIIKIGENTLEW